MFKWLKSWWKVNIVDDFPYPDECFDCNLESCENCSWRVK